MDSYPADLSLVFIIKFNHFRGAYSLFSTWLINDIVTPIT